MLWLFAFLGLVIVVVIALVVLGRETARLASTARPAVFDMTEAIDFIADRLPAATQARISHDDVRWILLADADLLEEATAALDAAVVEAVSAVDDDDVDQRGDAQVVDEVEAVARILELADASGRELADEDVVAVLEVRMDYLGAIGAIGPEA